MNPGKKAKFEAYLSHDPIITGGLREGGHQISANYKQSHEQISHLDHIAEIEIDTGSYVLFYGTNSNSQQFK